MSPGGRRGRTTGGSEEARLLRDLSPSATLRAFTEKPVPYDTSSEEFKIFACIESLTAAEKDLGARVAKAAQRLQSWCQEIEQWGWSGSFEEPSDEYREKRRKSLELRIREHVGESAAIESIGPLEYWGSLLSVEVESHEARLDDISDELLTLDIEELKEHVLDIHGPNKSRPSSAGYEATRQSYTPMDDFSFLITQTLLSALPHHFQLKDRLGAWTARVSILREAPRYLDELKMGQKAMKLGWDAIDPPTDTSDAAFDKWKEATDTISGVLHGKVSELGQRLDRMLDTLEGRQDCLPDNWIDIFEGVEADYGRWAHESRKRVIEFDVWRKVEQNKIEMAVRDMQAKHGEPSDLHSDHNHESGFEPPTVATGDFPASATAQFPANIESAQPESATVLREDVPVASRQPADPSVGGPSQDVLSEEQTSPIDDSVFEEGDTVVHNELEEPEESFSSTSDMAHIQPKANSFADSPIIITHHDSSDARPLLERPQTPRSRRSSVGSISSDISFSSSPPGAVEESPSVRNATNRQSRAPRPELNAAMSKRRNPENIKSLVVDDIPPWPPTQFSKQLSPNSNEDLDRKISDILETIPAHIRLTSKTGAEVTKSGRAGGTNKGGKGYLRAVRSVNGMKSPELTLSPAKSEFGDFANAASGRRSAAASRQDNDIKLYHLTQPGKEHPIKLFIRRVGENGERVMVRVGGGWADLGEYLRQYAEHHGRRTVSDGKFEILGLEVKNPSDGSPRPESAMSKRDRRFSGGHNGSPNTTPVKTAAPGIFKDDNIPPMPPMPSMQNLTNTPVGANNDSSAPSTGSSRHSWQGNEVGLAGPKAKKLDLSGEKLDWIEGMMKQARSVSGNMSASKADQHTPGSQREGADSRSESRASVRPQSRNGAKRPESRTAARKQPDFGDLGKVGGTKRIFLRNGALSEH
jgi:hypothetical protein